MFLNKLKNGKLRGARCCLLSLLSASLLMTSPALAGSRTGPNRKPTPTPTPAFQTWVANPVSSDWNTAANWTPATAPNSTSAKAVFGTSAVNGSNSIITFSSPVTTVGDLTFNANASPYIFQVTGTQSLVFTGSGITNNSGQQQLFLTTGSLQGGAIDPTTNRANPQNDITFKNSASSGNASLGGIGAFNFQDNSSAGTSTISLVDFANGKPVDPNSIRHTFTFIDLTPAGSKLSFSGHATAAQSNIYGDYSRVRTNFLVLPGIYFHDYSTAEASHISGKAYLFFDGHSNAGASMIDIKEGAISFSENATAGNATLSNGPSDGHNLAEYFSSSNEVPLTFYDNATAGSSYINMQKSDVVFFENTTAGTSSINKFSSLTFTDNATAGQSTIGSPTPTGSTPGTYYGYAAPSIFFEENAKAGSAQIYLRDTNRIVFGDNSSADHARIMIDGSYSCVSYCNFVELPYIVSPVIDPSGLTLGQITFQVGIPSWQTFTSALFFTDYSSADHADIRVESDGKIYFLNHSTASAATITLDHSFIAFTDYASGGTASITNNGGNFDMAYMATDLTLGSIAGTGDFYLGSRNLTTGGNNGSTVITGAIHDDSVLLPQQELTGGSLTKVGTGSMTLNGINSYTGRTTVNGGSLIIGDQSHTNAVITSDAYVTSGATLSGYGTIDGNLTATGGATIRPGGTSGTFGTLHVTGDYTQSATDKLEIQLSPTGNSQLEIDGTANLNGALLLNASSGTYAVGQVYNILTASALTGTFSSFSSTNGTNFKIDYSPANNPHGVDAVYLGAAANTPRRWRGQNGRTSNSVSVFEALGFAPEGSATDDLFFAAARHGGFDVYGSLGGEVQAAGLTSMAHGHWSFLDRLNGTDAVISEEGAVSLLGFDRGQSVPGDGVTAWSGHFNDDASMVARDAHFREAGDMSGASFNLGQGRRVGFASSRSVTRLDMTEGQQSSQFETIRLGGFASKSFNGVIADIVVGGSYMNISSDRGIGLIGDNATGSTQARVVGGEAGLSYPLQLGDFALKPHMGFGYAQMHQDAYGESGAGTANLQIDAADMTLMRSTMDLAISNKTKIGQEHSLASALSIGWEHQFQDVVPELREHFADTPEAAFIIAGADRSRDALHLGAALQTDLRSGVRLFANGDLSTTAQQTDHVMQLGLQVRF